MSNPIWIADARGQRVMVGLTADETAEYQSLLNVSAGVSCEEMQERLTALQQRHDTALAAVAAAAQDQPDGASTAAIAPGSNPPIDEDAT